jgi:hypothetical protein
MERRATMPAERYHDRRRSDPDQIRYALVVLAAWGAVFLAFALL